MALGDFLFPHVELKLVIAHSFETDIASTGDKTSKEYIETAARVELHKSDLQKLGLQDGKNTNLKTKTGSVVVSAFGSDKATEGIAVMPYGPWAMALVEVPSDDSPPVMHGVHVTATRSDEKVTLPEALFSL
ncbi:MAG: molybdopterin dinucleotide binding domain-containing protein [Candidatus Thorarchaeota archaeon]|nr:molybdopterin dinucleotide binding domain-containing protein [Candidatus Thorarchaeota archaeon]